MLSARTIIAAASLTIGSAAFAGFVDSEPANDTSAGADDLGTFGNFDSDVITAELDSGDVDWFTFEIDSPVDGFLTTITFPLSDPNSSPDTFMAVFDADLNMLGSNDDGTDSTGSAVRLSAIGAGTYYIAVTGAGDDDFDGLGDGDVEHDEEGLYALTVSYVVPAPASLALIGAGVMVGFRRRR